MFICPLRIQFDAESTTLRFFANEQDYALRLLPPKGMTLLPTQSRFHVSNRNMAVIIAKGEPTKWGTEMKIEAICASEIILADSSSSSSAAATSEGTASNPSAPESVGSASLLTNTMMYDLA